MGMQVAPAVEIYAQESGLARIEGRIDDPAESLPFPGLSQCPDAFAAVDYGAFTLYLINDYRQPEHDIWLMSSNAIAGKLYNGFKRRYRQFHEGEPQARYDVRSRCTV